MTKEKATRELNRIEVIPQTNGMESTVWLRKGIEQKTITNEYGDEEEVWVADECVCGTVSGIPTAEELDEDFDLLWGRFIEESLTDSERIADARDMASTNSDAIAELADMVAEGEVTMEDLAQAIVELAEIIGGGEE